MSQLLQQSPPVTHFSPFKFNCLTKRSGVSPELHFTHEQRSRLSVLRRSQQHRHLLSVQHAEAGQNISAAGITCFCEQQIDTGLSLYQTKALLTSLFVYGNACSSWDDCFLFLCVMKTSSKHCRGFPVVFLLFSFKKKKWFRGFTSGLAGETQENIWSPSLRHLPFYILPLRSVRGLQGAVHVWEQLGWGASSQLSGAGAPWKVWVSFHHPTNEVLPHVTRWQNHLIYPELLLSLLRRVTFPVRLPDCWPQVND